MSKKTPPNIPPAPAGAAHYWRSLEEREKVADEAYLAARAEAPEFGAPEEWEKPSFGRRGFLFGAGATLAVAGTACRRPVEHIVPYGKPPEQVIPGIPSHYATVLCRRGEALGLLVETHEGRPTKVEGNPLHPASLGAADLIAQASLFDLYDPDRLHMPATQGQESDAAAFDKALAKALKEAPEGEGLHVLAEPTNSPTFMRLRQAVLAKYPKAQFHLWAPASDAAAREGAKLALGQAYQVLADYDKAKIIVSLDCDFLQTEKGAVRATRKFADGRRLSSSSDSMSRLYAVGPVLTTTAANADHYLRLPGSQVATYLAALALELERQGLAIPGVAATVRSWGAPAGVPGKWLSTVAKELVAHRGASLLVAGEGQPAAVHALVHALNGALGNPGKTFTYRAPVDPERVDSDIAALAEAMKAGQAQVVVMLSGNPVYDAPADLGFAELLAKVPFSVSLSTHWSETAQKATWAFPRSHELETWGDARSLDGTLSVQQPLIAPLYVSRSEVELLAALAGEPLSGHALVRATLSSVVPGFTEHAWRRALRDGLFASVVAGPSEPALRPEGVAQALSAFKPAPAPTAQALELTFFVDSKMQDGRHAANAWLQELPDPMSKVVWDNVALLSPATAKALGVEGGDMLKVSLEGRSLDVPAWPLPGQADHTVALALGWGRTAAGRIGTARGFSAFALRTHGSPWFAAGATASKTGARHQVAQTQTHDSMEGRPLAREATLAQYQDRPNFAQLMVPPPDTRPLWKKATYEAHKWGMAIDLSACTGCNACVVACQSENNIGVVGKEQVDVGRELAWLRIDRYFVGDEHQPSVAFQPIACQQCEEAPCENVCPVNATAHSPEGLNDMAYNRCIGTRYCANNCPYKVRRFNYLDFAGEVWGSQNELDESKKLPESLKLAQNPNVTVRMRGVMEKCTYCVQRIQRVKIDTKRGNQKIRDGEIVPACAQTCPAQAITFGDLNDKESRVAKLAELDRHYLLLGEIGTAPRTKYLAKVRNPNPEMES